MAYDTTTRLDIAILDPPAVSNLPTDMLTRTLISATALLIGCAASHDMDGGGMRDGGWDSGWDAGVLVRDAGSDAGSDAGDDAGRPDSGFRCPPNPAYWDGTRGFVQSDGSQNPYCTSDSQCGHHRYDDRRSCYEGVCCNGRFDAATCACTCGDSGECPREISDCCVALGGTDMSCVIEPRVQCDPLARMRR